MPRRLPLLLLALLLAACGGAGKRKDDAPVVVSVIGAGMALADPSAGPLDPARRVLVDATAQGLVRFDAAGQIEPGLAERWIVIDDGRSFIFRLRPAVWPDGEPVTAAQVVRALRRATAPDNRSILAPFLAVIDEIVEMTPQVIEVRLKRPRPDLLKLFAQPEMGVVRLPDREGSGPFVALIERGGAMLRPARDPSSDDNDAPTAAETAVLRGERPALALARFVAGKSDLVLGGTAADWPLVAAAGVAPANVRTDPAIGLFGLAVVRREGFLADPAGRAAVAAAIDRAALTEGMGGDWAAMETLLPAQLDSVAAPARPAWAGLALDARRAEARQRVAAWRRANRNAPVAIRIALPAGPGAKLIWAHVAAGLLAIGAEPHRVGLEDESELRLIDAVAPYDSGRWFLVTACRPCAPAAVALIEAARDAPDLATRAQRIAEADAALTADAAFIPIAQPFRWSIVAMRLGAWQRNTRAWHPLNHLRNDAR